MKTLLAIALIVAGALAAGSAAPGVTITSTDIDCPRTLVTAMPANLNNTRPVWVVCSE